MQLIQEMEIKSPKKRSDRTKKDVKPKIVITNPVIKAYTFRVYPSKNQEVKLNKILATCRHLYNDALEERRRQAEFNNLIRRFDVFPWGKQEWISYEDQANSLTVSKTSEQKEVHSQVLQDVIKRVDRSFQNFFNGFGYPRFQGRGRYNTFTYPQSGFELVGGRLNLSKIGNARIFQHREIEGNIKTCTIKKDIDQWYAIFTCEMEKPTSKISLDITRKVGIDIGLKSLLTLSNGNKIEPPQFLRKSEKKLVKEQRRLSRKKLKSKNRKKQIIKVGKVHRRIRNQRKDFNHKTSRWLVNTYDHIVFEDLQIQNLLANHHLAKSIIDASWYQLQMFTKYKAEYAGKLVEFVSAKGTSQICNVCGNKEKLTLADRVFRCSKCGNIEDRDVNASKNIEKRGTCVPTDCRELTPTESSQKTLVEAGSSSIY